MQMMIWDSETDGSHGVAEDPFFVRIDEENGVLRINDLDANGMHMTTMLFIGPNAEENTARWNGHASSGDNLTQINCETESEIKKCFGLS